jgi:hypothetical protein
LHKILFQIQAIIQLLELNSGYGCFHKGIKPNVFAKVAIGGFSMATIGVVLSNDTSPGGLSISQCISELQL